MAIVGPGNIGIDLMKKITNKSKYLELAYMIGIYPDSEGLKMAEAPRLQDELQRHGRHAGRSADPDCF